MANSKNVIDVNDDNFQTEVLEATGPVLVDFDATWCGPCKALAPVIARIADENLGTIKVAKVDIDDSPAVAKRYGIRGAPTILVFRNGEKTAAHVGVTTKERLLSLISG